MNCEQYIGKELFYKSLITNKFTKFKVKSIESKITFVKNKLYAEIILISENGIKYNLKNDRIYLNLLNY